MKTMKLMSLAGMLLLVAACNKGSESCESSAVDDRVNTNPSTEDFTGVQLHAGADVFISDAETCGVRLEGDARAIDNLNIHVEDHILHIEKKKKGCFGLNHHVDVFVSAPLFTYLGISGSGNISAQTDFVEGTELNMNISGSGNITQLHLVNDATFVSISGSGNIETQTLTTAKLETTIKGSGDISIYTGAVPFHKSLMSGSGNILVMGMGTDKTDATLSGSGNIEVFAGKVLHAVLSGSGNFTYSGNPTITSSVTGSGNLIHK